MPPGGGTPDSSIATSIEEVESLLIETARNGAQQNLQQALESEIQTHLEANRAKVDEDGHQEVVRKSTRFSSASFSRMPSCRSSGITVDA